MQFYRAGLGVSLKTAAGLLLLIAIPTLAEQPDLKEQSSPELVSSDAGGQSAAKQAPASVCQPAALGSPFVPVDSWIYPAILRLYGMGFLDRVFLNMRPWTRSSISRMLEDVAAHIEDATPGPQTDQAQELYDALAHELRFDIVGPCLAYKGKARVESVYTIMRGVSGTPLRDKSGDSG